MDDKTDDNSLPAQTQTVTFKCVGYNRDVVRQLRAQSWGLGKA